MYNCVDLLEALITIKDFCLSYSECTVECPLYLENECECFFLKNKIPPEQWQVNTKFTGWKAIKD